MRAVAGLRWDLESCSKKNFHTQQDKNLCAVSMASLQPWQGFLVIRMALYVVAWPKKSNQSAFGPF